MSRPYVLINVASTVDGKIDTVSRRGAAMSSQSDGERVDRLRASVDAVMVGGRTLHDEDPRLTVKSPELRAGRLRKGQPENPAKVAVTSSVELRPESRFLTSGPARVILFVPHGSGRPSDDTVEVYEFGDGRVDLVAALDKLYEIGIRRLLVEGGGSLNFELFRLGLVDELQVYIAPLIFGGATAPTLADGAGLPRDLAIRLELESEPTFVTTTPSSGAVGSSTSSSLSLKLKPESESESELELGLKKGADEGGGDGGVLLRYKVLAPA